MRQEASGHEARFTPRSAPAPASKLDRRLQRLETLLKRLSERRAAVGALSHMRFPDVPSLMRCLEFRGLPRDVREEVFRSDFSQEQRLLLEKWMKELGQANERGPEALVPRSSLPGENPRLLLLEPLSFATVSHSVAEVSKPELVVAPPSASALALEVSRKQPMHPTQRKRKRDTGMRNLFIRDKLYGAEIGFDGVVITTRGDCDLSTAVEYLMVLTSIKQKMRCAGAQCFEERLKEAVMSACYEHGKSLLEMSLRFSQRLPAASFVGTTSLLTLGEADV